MSDIEHNEEQIIEISNVVDEYLIELTTKYKQHPLNLASIILARLIMTCKMTGCLDEFRNVISGLDEEVFVANTEVTKH